MKVIKSLNPAIWGGLIAHCPDCGELCDFSHATDWWHEEGMEVKCGNCGSVFIIAP